LLGCQHPWCWISSSGGGVAVGGAVGSGAVCWFRRALQDCKWVWALALDGL